MGNKEIKGMNEESTHPTVHVTVAILYGGDMLIFKEYHYGILLPTEYVYFINSYRVYCYMSMSSMGILNHEIATCMAIRNLQLWIPLLSDNYKKLLPSWVFEYVVMEELLQ